MGLAGSKSSEGTDTPLVVAAARGDIAAAFYLLSQPETDPNARGIVSSCES